MATQITMTIDGFDAVLPDANTKSIIERAIASARKDAEDKTAKLSEVQVKLDVALAQQKADSEKLATFDARVQQSVSELSAVIETARRYLGDNEKLDGLSKIGVMKKTVTHLLPSMKLDGFSDENVVVAFNTAIEAAPKPLAHVDSARAGLMDAAPRADSEPSRSTEEAKARSDARYRAQFVK